MRNLSLVCALALLHSVIPWSMGIAADWPHQRGPELSGNVVAGTAVPAKLPAEPRIVWQGPVADGFAAPIIIKGRVIYGDLQNGKETFHAINFADAKKLWSDELDSPHKDGFGTGPRCAAVSDGTVVFTQSCKAELHCLDLASGKLLWKTNYQKDYAALYTGEKGKTEGGARHGYNASPCIDGDQVIILTGGKGAAVVCLDKKTGKQVWKSQDDLAAYAPPVVATLAGVKQVVCFTVSGLIGLNRADGTLLWRVPMTTNYGRHVMAPVIYGDVVIAGSHEVGLIATRVVNKGGTITSEEAWKRDKDMGPNFSSPVLIGDHLYILVKKQVLCVNAKTGKETWAQDGLVTSSPDKGFASFLGMGDKLLLLNDAGELILFKADPAAYSEISRIQACGKNWCHPAYADGKLLLRDAKNLICLDLMGK